MVSISNTNILEVKGDTDLTPTDAPSFYEEAAINEKWPLNEQEYVVGRNYPYVTF